MSTEEKHNLKSLKEAKTCIGTKPKILKNFTAAIYKAAQAEKLDDISADGPGRKQVSTT